VTFAELVFVQPVRVSVTVRSYTVLAAGFTTGFANVEPNPAGSEDHK